ncbi:MAG: Xaa-Pro peptidase family protein [Thermoplasmata archaeon]
MRDRILKMYRHTDPKPDAIVVANSVDPHLDGTFFWMFDVPSGLFEGSLAIAHPDGELDVFTSALEAETARQTAKRDPHVRIHEFRTPSEIEGEVRRLVGETSTVGLHHQELTHAGYERLAKILPSASFVDVSPAIRRARATKDAVEIGRLERAAAIGSQVALEIPGLLHDGLLERDLATEMNHRMMRHGAEGPSFATIVAFGPNSAEPHYFAGERPLRSGDSIVCDFGALFGRYASDITRSFHFGRRDPELQAVHDKVEEAQQAALATIRAGVPARDVHLAAQQVIDTSPWKGRFTHGLGHSIGLRVHDGWGMNERSEDSLEEGMVITVEPGIYLPGRGGVRIEDDVVVTATGYRFLTTAPRGYLEVAA